MSDKPHSPAALARELPFLLLLNAVVALLTSLLGELSYFGFNLLVSNFIGALMWGGSHLLCHLQGSDRVSFRQLLLVMPLAVLGGFTLAATLAGGQLPSRFAPADSSALLLRKLLTMTLITFAAGSVFYYRYNHQRGLTELEAERRRAAELQQAETAARLALLQAQIEPHFLFNTLATVRSLIVRDAALAERVLDLLNDYLRASLHRTRRRTVTLGDELALITPLLEIAHIRMGARLRYHIAVPAALLPLPLPPLLLQPLVENALQHGIEPAVAGGEITIRAERLAHGLRLQVADNGLGLQTGPHTPHDGVGLANVRQRLAALYGEAAQLALYPQQPHGVLAEITLPLEPTACPAP